VLRKIARAFAFVIVVVFAGLALLGALQRPGTTLPPGVRGRHVDVAGMPIRYDQAGSGRDVLLVHGSPGSIEDWQPIVDRLAPRFRVTVYDRHGHGYSGTGRPHTPPENAAVARGLIQALGLRDVVYVGHSYGGITGLQLATAEAPEIAAYVLVGARAYPPVHVDRLFRILDVPALGTGFAALVAPFIGLERVDRGVRLSFGPNVASMPEGFVAPRAAMWSRPTTATALAEERTTLAEALDAMRPRYRSIRRPMTIVCGDSDHPNTEQAPRLAAEVPGARLVMLADTGHYVQFARPHELAAVIAETLPR